MSGQVVFPIPSFNVPHYLNRPPTGSLEFDLVPVITMVACVPTLALFSAKRRWMDLVLYGAGFVIAIIYHVLQLMAHDGLAANVFLGIDGAGWRTIDILSANVLLARTMGHALRVDHPFIAVLPNAVLPLGLVALLATSPGASLALASRMTLVVVGVTLALHLVVGGTELIASMGKTYTHPRMARAITSMALGIFTFVLPSIQPQRYWLYHSLWHVFMGVGYYELYLGLLADEAAGKAGGRKGLGLAAKAHRDGSSSSSSEESSSSDGEQVVEDVAAPVTGASRRVGGFRQLRPRPANF